MRCYILSFTVILSTVIVVPGTALADSTSETISADEYLRLIEDVFNDSSNGTSPIHQFRHSEPLPGILGRIVESSVNGSILSPKDFGVWDQIPCFFPKTDRIIGEYPNAPGTDGYGAEQVVGRYKMGDHYDENGPLAYFVQPNYSEQKSRIIRYLEFELMRFRPSRWLRQVDGISTMDITVTDNKDPEGKILQRTIEVVYSDMHKIREQRVTGQKITLISSDVTGEPTRLFELKSSGVVRRTQLIGNQVADTENNIEVTCRFIDLMM